MWTLIIIDTIKIRRIIKEYVMIASYGNNLRIILILENSGRKNR